MEGLLRLSRAIDGLSRRTGNIANWFVLLAALVSAFDALLRYSLSTVVWLDRWLSSSGGRLGWLFDIYRENSNSVRDLQHLGGANGEIDSVFLTAAWAVSTHNRHTPTIFSTGHRPDSVQPQIPACSSVYGIIARLHVVNRNKTIRVTITPH